MLCLPEVRRVKYPPLKPGCFFRGLRRSSFFSQASTFRNALNTTVRPRGTISLIRTRLLCPQDPAPIVEALANALPDVLNASVGELNFKNVVNKLGDVMYTFPFSLPPYYIAIIRCLGVLEGVALQVRLSPVQQKETVFATARLKVFQSALLFDGKTVCERARGTK